MKALRMIIFYERQRSPKIVVNEKMFSSSRPHLINPFLYNTQPHIACFSFFSYLSLPSFVTKVVQYIKQNGKVLTKVNKLPDNLLCRVHLLKCRLLCTFMLSLAQYTTKVNLFFNDFHINPYDSNFRGVCIIKRYSFLVINALSRNLDLAINLQSHCEYSFKTTGI